MKICLKCNYPITQGHNPKFCGGVKVVSAQRLCVGSEFNNKSFEIIKTENGVSAVASGGIVVNAKGEGKLKPVTMDLHLKSIQEQIKALQEKEKEIKEVMGLEPKK